MPSRWRRAVRLQAATIRFAIKVRTPARESSRPSLGVARTTRTSPAASGETAIFGPAGQLKQVTLRPRRTVASLRRPRQAGMVGRDTGRHLPGTPRQRRLCDRSQDRGSRHRFPAATDQHHTSIVRPEWVGFEPDRHGTDDERNHWLDPTPGMSSPRSRPRPPRRSHILRSSLPERPATRAATSATNSQTNAQEGRGR